MSKSRNPSLALIFGSLLLIALIPRVGTGAAVAQVETASGGSSFSWPDNFSIVQHQLPTPGAQPWAVTTDPQGRVWFVEQNANKLGEYDPGTGGFQELQIPTPLSGPEGIASDSRGDIWFTELTSDRLGELPAGGHTVLEFPIPSATVSLAGTNEPLTCGPGAVLSDPSGDVWVSCLFSNQIDEFFPHSGSFASYDLPVFQSGPAGLLFDGKGDLWFTAADSEMLGKAVVSELRNGTAEGIDEFAPINQTYLYRFSHATSFLGSSTVLTSSLPTPSGIAMDASGRLWITEHVDSSFDSYDVETRSLVKYWTSQTFGAYGFSVSFPNGIAVDRGGNVWIGEHYGNKIAEFDPSVGKMTEYPVPCCGANIAGVYSVALDPNGRLWFVEISGDAIAELVPSASLIRLTLDLPRSTFTLNPGGSVTIPLQFAEASGSKNSTAVSLSVSGVSGTGSLENMSAAFTRQAFSLAPGGQSSSNLTLSLGGISPGTYYLTLSATATPGGAVNSGILKLVVSGPPAYPFDVIIPAVALAVAVTSAAGFILARRSHGRAGRRRPPSLRDCLTMAKTSSATPAPAAT